MRMNGVGKQDIEEFVIALSGKKLSVREIEQLAHGYFRGRYRFAKRYSKDTWPWLWTGFGKCPRTRMAPTSLNGCC
jgi:hypothetical protein